MDAKSWYCTGCGKMCEQIDGKCSGCGKDNSQLIKLDAWYQRVNVILDNLRKCINEVKDTK
jgi:hypothetical protein